MLNKRCITLPVVYRRPFASKAVFWANLKDFEFPFTKSFKIAQKTAFEAQGPQVRFQRLFNIDLYKYLAMYRYRWSKR